MMPINADFFLLPYPILALSADFKQLISEYSLHRHSQGANRRREAAGLALRGVLVIFRARQQNCWESSGWAGGRLLRLQRQRSRGQGGVRHMKNVICVNADGQMNKGVDNDFFPSFPVTYRQAQSWFWTDSLQMSAGLKTEWSPVWTGPLR